MTEITISQLSELTGRDRRTLKKRLNGQAPIRTGESGGIYFDSVTALGAIYSDSENPQAEKSRLDRLRADQVELALGRERGELVATGDVGALWSKLAVQTKTRLLSIPSKVAAQVIGCRRIPQVKAILESAIHDALDALADGRGGIPGGIAPAAAVQRKRVGRRKAPAKP